MPIELLGKSKSELAELAVSLGEPSYRGAQLYQAVYVERLFDLAKMSTLPAAFRGSASVTNPSTARSATSSL
jgi:adenine C2-methylase RlmN of 23S rRNA A2503 and tRNA A37